jgi:hypothetical protein
LRNGRRDKRGIKIKEAKYQETQCEGRKIEKELTEEFAKRRGGVKEVVCTYIKSGRI